MWDKRYDVVYLYKKVGTQGLRFSLRSLVHVPVRDVIFVGDMPEWVQNAHHIPYEFGASKILNEWGQMFAACEATSEFLLFNDDFYLFEPLTHFAFHKKHTQGRGGKYQKAYNRTKSHFKDFKNYEVHIPMHFDSSAFRELKNAYTIKREYLHRSLYGNHYKIDSVFVRDNKVYSPKSIDKVRGGFASTTNKVERHKDFISKMSEIFKQSKYERDDIHQP